MSESTMTMPSLGETMEHGIVAAWLVQEGQSFSRGDPIIEFETDKTAVEYPALGDGVLLQQLVKEGDQVMIGAPIATVDIGNGPDWLSAHSATGPKVDITVDHEVDPEVDIDTTAAIDPDGGADAISSFTAQSAPASPALFMDISAQAASMRATPVARKLARQQGLPLHAIVATGRRGRIEQRDIEAAISRRDNRQDMPACLAQDDSAPSIVGGIACHARGAKTGTPCLLLHGFAADHSTWTLLSGALAKAGCRATAADLPGHGHTRIDAMQVGDLSAGIDQVLVDAAGHQACHVIAHSLGAVPAVKLALSQANAKAPSCIASLTLIAPVGLGLFIDSQFVFGMAAPSSRAELTHLLRRLSDRPIALSSNAIDALYESLQEGRLNALAKSFVSATGQQVDLHAAIASLAQTTPVRIIVGHADRIIDWQEALSVSPLVSVHHMPAAGHMPQWDEPRVVAEIILSAIR